MKYEPLIEQIAQYVAQEEIQSNHAYDTAILCLADALGCALLALQHKACTKLLGPIVPNTLVPNGSRVPGTSHILDPIRAAFNITAMIRWLDYNDTFLGAEWGHPSDNLGGLLALSDYLSQTSKKITIHDLLRAMIKAYEIQGILSLQNSFNRVGFDHVIFVKIATSALSTSLWGGDQNQIAAAVSQSFLDVGPLRVYRHAPNTGPRKSWAAADATSRGLFFADLTMRGEPGYHTPLSARGWGLYDVLFQGKPFQLERPFASYIMENILFKITPAEFHAQTALECAIKLHPSIKDKSIQKIEIATHEPALRIIDKKGPLKNPADRDHCLQYMVAIGLLFGELKAHHYEDDIASDPRIDLLREKITVKEDKRFSEEYYAPTIRSVANSLTIYFEEGPTASMTLEFPLGHPRRRKEVFAPLIEKFHNNLSTCFEEKKVEAIQAVFQDREKLMDMPVKDFMKLFTKSEI